MSEEWVCLPRWSVLLLLLLLLFDRWLLFDRLLLLLLLSPFGFTWAAAAEVFDLADKLTAGEAVEAAPLVFTAVNGAARGSPSSDNKSNGLRDAIAVIMSDEWRPRTDNGRRATIDLRRGSKEGERR